MVLPGRAAQWQAEYEGGSWRRHATALSGRRGNGDDVAAAMANVTIAPEAPTAAAQAEWYRLPPDEVARAMDVDAARGLTAAEAAARLERHGPNKFAEAKSEPRWHAFVRQYYDAMQVVLLVAGVGSIWPLHQYGTGIVLLLLTVFNAMLGLQQEGKAAAAVAALQKMMIIKAKVRRDGELLEVPAEQLVPGDIVSIEAGDIVPADGRLLQAATLEIAEAALTGESLPVAKGVERLDGDSVPLGDRTDMVFMNTNATPGPPSSSSRRPACRPRSATSRTCCKPRTRRPRRSRGSSRS